uniref:Candidate secreted effector n=1 Tax=Meloidogyne incognita TaxID=6306 RepID=A0A914LPZ5_MELIC
MRRRGLHPNDSDNSRSITSHQIKEGIQGQQNTKIVHPINQPKSKVSIQQGEIEPISGIILVNPTPKTVTLSQTSIPRIEVSKTSQGTNRVINNGGQQINTGSNQEMNCESLKESIASSSIIIGQDDGIEIINSNTSSNSATPCCLEEQMLSELRHENVGLTRRKEFKSAVWISNNNDVDDKS